MRILLGLVMVHTLMSCGSFRESATDDVDKLEKMKVIASYGLQDAYYQRGHLPVTFSEIQSYLKTVDLTRKLIADGYTVKWTSSLAEDLSSPSRKVYELNIQVLLKGKPVGVATSMMCGFIQRDKSAVVHSVLDKGGNPTVAMDDGNLSNVVAGEAAYLAKSGNVGLKDWLKVSKLYKYAKHSLKVVDLEKFDFMIERVKDGWFITVRKEGASRKYHSGPNAEVERVEPEDQPLR